MLEKASRIATKPNIIHSAPANLKDDGEVEGNDEDQNKADLEKEDIDTNEDEDEKEDTETPTHPPPSQHIINPNPINLTNNDEDHNKPGSEEEDIVTTDDEDEKEVRKDPTYKYRTTVENNNKRVTRSNKNPATPHCSLITSTYHS
jgi:hypothetical protein